MNTVWTARFPQLHRGIRTTILLLLALSIAPAAPAQEMGFAEGLSGTLQFDTGKPTSTAAGSLSERTASHPLVPEDILEPFPQPALSNHVSAVGGLGARQGAPARRIADEMHPMAAVTPSLSRHLLIGSGIGAVAGTVFALAVASLADCGGPHCLGERVIGVAGHAAAGAVVGAVVGSVTYLVRK